MQHQCCDLAAWEGVNRRECFTVHIYGQMPKKNKQKKTLDFDFDNENPIPLSKQMSDDQSGYYYHDKAVLIQHPPTM